MKANVKFDNIDLTAFSTEKELLDAINAANAELDEKIYEDGIHILTTTKQDADDYHLCYGHSIKDGAIRYIKKYSQDGTLKDGLMHIKEQFPDSDPVDVVSFEISKKILSQ